MRYAARAPRQGTDDLVTSGTEHSLVGSAACIMCTIRALLLVALRRQLALAVAVCLFGVLACTSASSPEIVKRPLVLCGVQVAVSVTGGTTPTFSWTPGCGATYFEVVTADGREVTWIVQGDTGKIASGVLYGVAPAAYASRYGPVPLRVGTPYRARVGTMIDEDSFAVWGDGLFVP